jgi:hypothetical protein
MDNEIRPILGFEGLYSIDKLGNVYSHRLGKMVRPSLIHGYYAVHLTPPGGGGKYHLIRKLVMSAFVGECPVGSCVVSIDEDTQNHRLDNLEYKTRSACMIRAYETVRDRRHHPAESYVIPDVPLAKCRGVRVLIGGECLTFGGVGELLKSGVLAIGRRQFNRVMKNGGEYKGCKIEYL